MKGRCYCKTHTSYIKYGAKGITVCQEWMDSYDSFYVWSINNGYHESLTIDRIDGRKGYDPENCRYVGYREQNLNLNKKPSASGFIGVARNGKKYMFRVRVTTEFRFSSLTIYESALDAAIAYNKYCDLHSLTNQRNII